MKPSIAILLVSSMLVTGTHAASGSAQTGAAEGAATCLAVMPPAVEGVEGSATGVADAARDLLVAMLSGPSTRVMPVNARLAGYALEEAREQDCGVLVVARLIRKRHGGGGWLGRAAGQAGSTLAWQIPGGSIGASVAREVAMAGAQTVSELASATRARDEMRAEYRLAATDGRAVPKPGAAKVKASVDGEDLLTPLVQRVAESIATAVPRQ